MINKLKEKLETMVKNNCNYDEIVKVSQKLDRYILLEMRKINNVGQKKRVHLRLNKTNVYR